MENSKIEWTDHTFNPWIGCTKVSDGCKHCYAEALMDKRYGRVKWGPQGARQRTSEANWRKPLQWNKQAAKEERRYRVFCSSLADVFEDRPELEAWRGELFNLIVETPNLDWLLLTKRPENINRMVADYAGDCAWLGWNGTTPRTNIWIGTSVENQEQAIKRIPHLLNTYAHIKFLSCEPLLGQIDLEPLWYEWNARHNYGHCKKGIGFIDWIIVGGESGHGARPMSIEWASKLRYQATENHISFFMKQLGGVTDKRHDLEDMPIGLRVREFPR
jgi:protein gp37